MQKSCADRKTVVFLPLVKTSQKFRDILNERGFRGRRRSTEIPTTARRYSGISKPESTTYSVIQCSLTEGWDCPPLRGLRDSPPPDKGARTLLPDGGQRNARLSPGKKDPAVTGLPLAYSAARAVQTRAHLICESDEVAQKMTENLAAAGCPLDITEAEERAETDVVAQREEALAKQLSEMRAQARVS